MAREYHKTFVRVAPILVQDFIDEFKLAPFQACGFVGNFGHESSLISGQQEGKPLGTTAPIRGPKGGIDLPQWTGYGKGGRRELFADFVEDNNLPYPSYKASWEFIKHELKGSHKHALEAVRKTTTLKAAVETAGFHYEKFAGYENFGSANYKVRTEYAQRALELWEARQSPTALVTVEMLQQQIDELAARVTVLEKQDEQ